MAIGLFLTVGVLLVAAAAVVVFFKAANMRRARAARERADELIAEGRRARYRVHDGGLAADSECLRRVA